MNKRTRDASYAARMLVPRRVDLDKNFADYAIIYALPNIIINISPNFNDYASSQCIETIARLSRR